MVMTKEEIILNKLFVALDDRSLNLKRIGQHLERLPRSYALESLAGALEECALFIEQQKEQEEQAEERDRQLMELLEPRFMEGNPTFLGEYGGPIVGAILVLTFGVLYLLYIFGV
tara:strand:+ start:304 stop:648 length:345 start_codon:yes stop_codon:yes gene_type:complete